MEFSKVLENRYSVRDFKDLPVEDEKIEAILDAGRNAPTAKNTQCQKIYVLKSKEAIDKVREISRCAFNAPLVILTCGDEDRQCFLSIMGKSLMETDVAIVNTHMMLKATELGLGTCWVCYFDPKRISQEFNLPDNIKPLNLLLVGYTADGYQPNERHFDKRPYDEVVKFL